MTPATVHRLQTDSRDDLMRRVQLIDQRALSDLYDALQRVTLQAATVQRSSTLPVGVREIADRIPEVLGPMVANMQKLEGVR